MPQWVVLVPVTVEAATPDEAVAWVTKELAARLEPDQGGTWHSAEAATPRYQVGSVRRVAEGPNAVPSSRPAQG